MSRLSREELDALPVGAVVRETVGEVGDSEQYDYRKVAEGGWVRFGELTDPDVKAMEGFFRSLGIDVDAPKDTSMWDDNPDLLALELVVYNDDPYTHAETQAEVNA